MLVRSLSIALAVFSCLGCYSQKGFTFRVSGGYAFAGFIRTEGFMSPKIDSYTPEVDALVTMANRSDFPDSTRYEEPIRGSYGQGGNFTFAPGYMINPYCGVELGISYLHGAKRSAREIHEVVINDGAFITKTGYTLTADISTRAASLILMPSVVLIGAKPGAKVYPYGRLGISLPVWGHLQHDVNIHVQDELFTDAPAVASVLDTAPYFLGRNTKVKLETEGTVSIGVNGALGIGYRPLPYLSITAEINGQFLSTRAKSTTVKQWDTESGSKLEERGVYRTEFLYHDRLDQNSNNADYNQNYSTSKPKDDLRPVGSFSNIGLNLGVVLLISKDGFKKGEKKPKRKG